MNKTIVIERYRLGTGYGVVWAYNYRIDGGMLCQYGTGLSSLLSMLRRKHPDATIVKDWTAC